MLLWLDSGVERSNPSLYSFIQTSFQHFEGVKEVLEARYGEVWSRTTNPRQRDLHVLLDQDRRGLAQGAFVPETTSKVWAKVQKNRVKALASRAGKELAKTGDPTKRYKEKGGNPAAAADGDFKSSSGGQPRQNSGGGRGRGR